MRTTFVLIIVGCALLLLAVILSVRFMTGNTNSGTEYDERQVAARGSAYRDGFWAMAVVGLLLWLFGSVLPGNREDWFLGMLFLGITVFAVSSILRDAFFRPHQKIWPAVVTWSGAGITNFLIYYTNLIDEELCLIYLFLSLTMLIPAIALLLRHLTRPEEEDE